MLRGVTRFCEMGPNDLWNDHRVGKWVEMIEWKWLITENKYNHLSRTPYAPNPPPPKRVPVLRDIAIYLAYWQWSQFSAKCNLNYLFLLTRSSIATADTQCCYWDMIHKCRLQITNPTEKLNWVEHYLNCDLFFIYSIRWTSVSLVLTKLTHTHTHTHT